MRRTGEGVPVPEVEEGDQIEPCSGRRGHDGQQSGDGRAHHQRDRPGGRDADGGHVWASLDADGLTNATFSYQWLADDAEIAGATGSTYTLADTDEGKAIKVQVSFTDDEGNE